RIVIAHHNKGMSTRTTRGEGSRVLALINREIDPTLLQAAFAQNVYIFLAHRSQAFANYIHSMAIGNIRGVLSERELQIIGMERFQPGDSPTQRLVAMPDILIFAERLKRLMKDFRRDVIWS